MLVDFWTYSCINCQRSLPHVEAWYSRYHQDGFEVVGVHTPEFAFEHVVSNVMQAAKQLGVDYPIAIDNGYKTWDAYQNESWPAEYLIDATGQVRHADVRRRRLRRHRVAHPHAPGRRQPQGETPAPHRRPRQDSDDPPDSGVLPRLQYGLPNFDGTSITENQPAVYKFPSTLPPDYLAFSGTWTVGPEKITAGPDARIELAFMATDVYLVLGGTGTIKDTVGSHTETIDVSGLPRLYTLVSLAAPNRPPSCSTSRRASTPTTSPSADRALAAGTARLGWFVRTSVAGGPGGCSMIADLVDPRRSEPTYLPGERAMLEGWLEFHRTTLLLKCEGLDRRTTQGPARAHARSCRCTAWCATWERWSGAGSDARCCVSPTRPQSGTTPPSRTASSSPSTTRTGSCDLTTWLAGVRAQPDRGGGPLARRHRPQSG